MNESRNPKSNVWQMMPKYYASRTLKIQFLVLCFWFCFVVLQVTMFNVVLQWSGFGELVLGMERNPCCSIDNLYGECESRFLEMIGVKLSREQKDVDKEKLYEVGWGERREGNFLLGGWEKLSFDSSSYEVWSLFGFW